MKKKFLVSLLAAVAAAFTPLAAFSQAAPAGSSAAEQTEPNYKYEVFAGYAYTSLNQVNQSRYGLQGVDLSTTRNLGEHFGILAEGGYYKYATGNGNPGDPSVSTVLFGPTFHADLYGKVSAFVNLLLGGEHSGGEEQTPKVSLAGGFGGGLNYKLSPHLSLRAQGERIGDSFSLNGNTKGMDYSQHTHWNARAAFGVVYHF